METSNLDSIHIMSEGCGSLHLFTSSVGVSLSDDDWIYEYSRISPEVILLIFFLRTVVFGFTPDLGLVSLWFLATQALSGTSSILSSWPQVKSDIGEPFPQVLCHYCPNIFCRQDRLQVKDFVAWLVSTFLFWQPTEYLSTTKRLEHWGKGSMQASTWLQKVGH